ncbi:MAG: type II toxin-antitoxin system Phd/YefM family antitoxin [Nitrospirota bacterium]|nr:type II toxin-antitoxin system Phd/YefM family antitoxin [Nitrospirota bacterium]
MGVLTASEARANIYQLLNKAATTHEPILITGKRHNADLVSEDDWMAIQETLSFVSSWNEGMEESLEIV